MDKESLNNIIRKNIKKYRILNKLSQKQLAIDINKPYSYINNIENNKIQINIKDIYKISIVLNVPINKFFE